MPVANDVLQLFSCSSKCSAMFFDVLFAAETFKTVGIMIIFVIDTYRNNPLPKYFQPVIN
jgi:hypothetical protein